MKASNAKLYRSPSGGSRADICVQTDRQADIKTDGHELKGALCD